jgi:uncharacterized damage-inducible protein DinB
MSELERAIIGDSAAAPAAHILEELNEELVHREVAHVPHSIYDEVWHLAYWQQVTLDWISGVETPYPVKPGDGFPVGPTYSEGWESLRERFLQSCEQAAAAARDADRLEIPVRCPSRPGEPVRVMTVREQLESLAAHNSYHLGRVVVLRQLQQVWPPASGGFSW